MEKIWVVVGDDQWRVNNQLDDKYQVRPIHEILRDAQGYVNTVLPYCLFSQNCEHFVTEVRYGKAESRQVRQAVASSALAGLGLILAGAVAAFIRGGSETNKNDEY